jgi:hypothetical protein
MYATNALRHSWMKEVKTVVFGPSQKLSLKDKEIQGYLKDLIDQGNIPVTCKYIADEESIANDLSKLGLDVVYVGTLISDYIKADYIPMVF